MGRYRILNVYFSNMTVMWSSYNYRLIAEGPEGNILFEANSVNLEKVVPHITVFCFFVFFCDVKFPAGL